MFFITVTPSTGLLRQVLVDPEQKRKIPLTVILSSSDVPVTVLSRDIALVLRDIALVLSKGNQEFK